MIPWGHDQPHGVVLYFAADLQLSKTTIWLEHLESNQDLHVISVPCSDRYIMLQNLAGGLGVEPRFAALETAVLASELSPYSVFNTAKRKTPWSLPASRGLVAESVKG